MWQIFRIEFRNLRSSNVQSVHKLTLKIYDQVSFFAPLHLHNYIKDRHIMC
jgi:hypothetical protein